MAIRLAVSGVQGRMGRRIAALASADEDFDLAVLLEHPRRIPEDGRWNDIPVVSDVGAVRGCDCLIEFTTPEATMDHLEACLREGVAMVIGTTGFEPAQAARIGEAARTIPVVWSSNMSIGVNLLFKLTEVLARSAPDAYKVRVSETHHVHKKDAPSGTAKTLAHIIEEHGRTGEVPIASIREGEVIGDHTVHFESADDEIVLRHHARNRDIFARGSLTAAKFLKDKGPGLYTMQDVLGLR